jgi:nucleotide-binding universal stress UspA family protein
MSIARILAPLNGTSQDAIAVASAIRAARPFNAHVSAVFAHPDPAEAIPFVGMPLTGDAVLAIIDGQTKLAMAAARSARATLLAVCKDEAAEFQSVPERRGTVTCSFRELVGRPAKVIAEAASLCDLAVSCRHSPGALETILDVLLQAQRPVLLCSDVPDPLFERVTIGWNGGACAAHALLAAMPYLERAKSVEIVSIDHGHPADLSDVESCLRLHGVLHSTARIETDRRPIPELLLERMKKTGADTLVIGGYGHSRARETLFGGVTIETLLHGGKPVFLMH